MFSGLSSNYVRRCGLPRVARQIRTIVSGPVSRPGPRDINENEEAGKIFRHQHSHSSTGTQSHDSSDGTSSSSGPGPAGNGPENSGVGAGRGVANAEFPVDSPEPGPNEIRIDPNSELLARTGPLRHKVRVSDAELSAAREAAFLVERHRGNMPVARKGDSTSLDKAGFGGGPNSTSLIPQKNELMTRRRIPPNFVKEVLMPHLERWIWAGNAAPPSLLMDVLISYSQLPSPNKTMCWHLSNSILYRLEDFNGPEFCKMLLPFCRIRPNDEKLFAMLSIELEEHFLELSTLNLIAIVRAFARQKRQNEQMENFLIGLVIPRLQKDIATYDVEELSALLTALAAASDRMDVKADIPLLAAIVPQFEKKFDETPLLLAISNVNSLCRLKIYHKRLISLLAKDLNDPNRVRNIPAKYIALVYWTFSRYGLLDAVFGGLINQAIERVHEFTARDFCRLVQAFKGADVGDYGLADDGNFISSTDYLLRSIAMNLMDKLMELKTDEFCFLFLGLARAGYLPGKGGTIPKAFLKYFTNKGGVYSDGKDDTSAEGMENEDENDDDNLNEESEDYHRVHDELNGDFMEIETEDPAIRDGDEDVDDLRRQLRQERKAAKEEGKKDTRIRRNEASDGIILREHILNEMLKYMTVQEDEFSESEIQRLARVIFYSEDYQYISALLPPTWEEIVNDVRNAIDKEREDEYMKG